MGARPKGAHVILLDSLGELAGAYMPWLSLAGLAWIGGSFQDFGGQNPLEAAALGVPVFFGPSMRHFPDVAQALLEAERARQVAAAVPGLRQPGLGWKRAPGWPWAKAGLACAQQPLRRQQAHRRAGLEAPAGGPDEAPRADSRGQGWLRLMVQRVWSRWARSAGGG